MFRSVQDQTAALVRQRMSWVQDAQACQLALDRHRAGLNAILRLLPPGSSSWMWTERIEINVPVKSFEELAPIIESIEEVCGISFDGTEDRPEQGLRVYRCKSFPWIEIQGNASANDQDEGARCKRVIVGSRVMPEYELRCGDEAVPPNNSFPGDTPEPAKDFPF